MHTVLSNENGKFYTNVIYPCFSRSVCFLMGSPVLWRFGLCWSGSSLVSRWRDVTLVREFQMGRCRCKQIDRHWFQGRQMRFWWMLSTIYFWYIRSDCLIQQIFNQSPPAAYFQQFTGFTGSCYNLWIRDNSLWHREYPGHTVDWCQLYFQGKYVFYVLIHIFFKLEIFCFNFYNILYAQFVNTSLYGYFGPKYFVYGVCSTARVSR